MRGQQKTLPLHALLGILSFIALYPALFRPFWFDESITLLDFARLPDFAAVYRNYVIPNNHIIFTMLLKIYLEIVPAWEPFVRLLSVAIALASVLLAFDFWRKRTGESSAFAVLVLLVFSSGFQIYGTAVRGYMLSFMLVLLSLEFAVRFCESRKMRHLIAYFASALLAVGTIPSNVAPLLAVALVALFETASRSCVPQKPSLPKLLKSPIPIFFATPFASLLIFYLPILPKFLNAMSLKEGWPSFFDASLNFYGFVFIAFLPILPAMAFSVKSAGKQIGPLRALIAILVFIMPATIFFLKSPAPFPRTFFPFLPPMLFLFAKLAEPAFKKLELWPAIKSQRTLFLCMIGIAAFLGWTQTKFSATLSKTFTRSGNQDDYFKPYFLKDFSPGKAAIRAHEILNSDDRAVIFVDRRADYPSLLLYAGMLGVSKDRLLYDLPTGRPASIPNNRTLYLILPVGANPAELKERFSFSGVETIDALGGYEIMRCNP